MIGDYIFVGVIVVLASLTIIYLFYDNISIYWVGLLKNRRITTKFKKFVRDNDFLYLNNLTLRVSEGNYINVDHIIFGDKYIYVIGAKFWLGYVVGKIIDEKWILSDGKLSQYLDNPLKTNDFKCQVIGRIANARKEDVINIILIAKSASIHQMDESLRNFAVLEEKNIEAYILDKERNSPVNVLEEKEIESIAARLYHYHLDSLRDKKKYHIKVGR